MRTRKKQQNSSEHFSAKDTLIACENETSRLIKQGDLWGVAVYLADDLYDIFADGVERTKSELLEFLREADLKDYQISNFRVTMLNKDAGVVTYHVNTRGLDSG